MSKIKDALSRLKRQFIPRPLPPSATQVDGDLRRLLGSARTLSGSYVYQRALFEQARATIDKYLDGRASRTLHIGCGDTLGIDVLLCHAGTEQAVAFDPAEPVFNVQDFCQTWESFHTAFTCHAVELAEPVAPLPQVQKTAAGYSVGNHQLRVLSGLTLEQNGLDGEFDYSFSNATLEHVYDPSRCVSELRRLLRTGGVTAHQIDLRDHNDFNRPLEFLRFSQSEWKQKMQELEGDTTYMNRWRLSQWRDEFAAQGFEILECFANLHLDAAKVEAARSFLHEDYRHLSTQELCELSVWLVARKI